ncbi:MAG: phosphatase PAP2 family protein [Candidatus Aenigmatarchaeota archaeon]
MWEWISWIGMPELGLMLIPFLVIGYKVTKSQFLKSYSKIYIPSILAFLLLAFVIKSLLPIPRPCIPCPAEGCNPLCPTDASFPSGHSGTVWIMFLPLVLLKRNVRIIPILIIPVLVCASRLALGVHTFYDVLAGAGMGIAITCIFYKYRP